ncbi:MAG: right-handed parallel beta-helix repeat-containing protein [Candidatus Falkowbacteria bacterium]
MKFPNFPISQFLLISFVLIIGIFYFGQTAFGATEFISWIDPDSGAGTSYTSLYDWEAAVQSNLTAATTKVFSFNQNTASGTIPDATAVRGQTSGATATLVHSASSTDAHQILLSSVSGTFQSGEQVYVNATGASSTYVILTNAGDSAIAVAKCRSTAGSADTTSVEINGWTTATTTYIKIWTDPTDTYGRHKGKWDDDKYRIQSDYGINVIEDYVVIDGLQIYLSSYVGEIPGVRLGSDNAANNSLVTNNIIKFTDPGNGSWDPEFNGVMLVGDYLNASVFNNIIYDAIDETGNYGIGVLAEVFNKAYIYNNTVYNCHTGYRKLYDYDGDFRNNIAQDNVIDFNVSTNVGTHSRNLSSDWTSPGTDSITSTTVQFLDAANDDFHLSPNDTAARDAGTSTVFWDANAPVKYDIDYTARGGAIDIGADEAAVEFVSTICESASAGGDCAQMDYSRLFDWEDEVEADLTASTTRVFSGTPTGSLAENNSLDVYVGGSDTNINVVVVATTSDQILIDGLTGTSSPLIVASGTQFRLSGGTTNMWTVTGTLDALGASPIAVAKIDGVWTNPDTEYLYIDATAWITDNDNFVKVYTVNDARHKGKWSDTAHRLVREFTVNGQYVIYPRTHYVKIDGLQIHKNSTVYNGYGINVASFTSQDNEIEISNNIIKGEDITGGQGVSIGSSLARVKIYNNIIYKASSPSAGDGIWLENDVRGEIYNNTVYKNYRGIYVSAGSAPSIILKNNISFDNVDYDFQNTAFSSLSSHNVSSDESASSTSLKNGVINFSGADHFFSIASGTEDFHLVESSSLINAGFDISASSTLNTTSGFVDEIDGGPRNPDDLGWDIGADETAAKQYRSVGNIATSLGSSGTVTISSSARTATFSAEQADNIGVGDVIQFGGVGYYTLAFITSRASSTVYYVQAWDTKAPTATTSAAFNIFRAHLTLNDWEAQTVADVNSGISDTVDDWVVMPGDDLVSSNTSVMVAAYASASGDTEAVTIDGWTTGEQNYIKVYTPVYSWEVGESQRHSGKWDDSKYAIVTGDAMMHSISIGDDFVRIEGIQINHNESLQPGAGIYHYTETSGDIHISNNIIKKSNLYTNSDGIELGSTGMTTYYIWNNIIFNFSGSNNTAVTAFTNGNVYTDNNTIYNCAIGLSNDASNSWIARNNIVSGSGNANAFVGTFSIGTENNATDGTDAIGQGTNNLTGQNFLFWDPTNTDFHLAPGSAGIDQGTSTVSSIVTEDIDGKPIHTWDIGADDASVEFVATVMESGGDFSSLSSWEAANDVDLTATTTMVFTCSTMNGDWPTDSSVVGTTSFAVASSTTFSTSSMQIMLYNIASSTFVTGEKVIIQGGDGSSNYCILGNAGNYPSAAAKIDGAWTVADTGYVNFNGWSSDKYNYIKVYTTSSARHTGVWNEQKFRFVHPGKPILINEDYVTIDGLQIETSGTGNYDWAISNYPNYTASGFIISNNIIRSSNTVGSSNSAIPLASMNGDIFVFNNIIYNFRDSAIVMDYADTDGHLYIYNNIVVDCGIGIDTNQENITLVSNNLVLSCSQDFAGSFISSSSNNISSDSSAPGTNSQTNTTVTFVDAGNGDFHLMPENADADGGGKNPAIDAGTSTISNFQFPISNLQTDAAGNERYDARFDVGALEGPTILYRSVGQHGYNLNSGAATVSISSSTAIATFSGDLPANVGVGDIIQFGGAGYYDVAFIHGRISSSTYDVRDRYGKSPTATTTAAAQVFRAHLLLDDWEDQTVDPDVNSAIDSSVDDLVLVPSLDLTASNTALFVPCYASSSADATVALISGWTTATSSYIKIFTPAETSEVGASQRHTGSWDDTKYRYVPGSTYSLRILDEDVNIEGLQIDSGVTAGLWFDSAISYNINFKKNIIRGDGYGLGMLASAGIFSRINIYNNLIYSISGTNPGYGISADGNDWTVNAYNNTVYGQDSAFESYNGAVVNAVNNVVFGNNDDFYSSVGAFSLDYNASDDGDGTNAISLGSSTAVWDATFVDWQNYDFRIRDTASVLYDAGTTITLVTDDIAGNARPSDDAFDIGAFEYVTGRAKYRFLPGGTFKMKGTIKFK